METLSFCDNFWGDKHQGYEVLSQNTKSCTKTSGEFLDLLRDIYSLEDTCTKAWSRVAKQINVNSSGSLQPYWQAIKDLSERHSTVHYELTQNIQSIIKSVQRYIDEQQSKQKATKEIDIQTQNITNLLSAAATQLSRAKDVYDARYLEFQKFHRSDQNNTNKTREIERLESKLKKAVDEYKYNIEKYNNTCTKFKSKMIESCTNFQEIETFHLEQMKEFICRFANCFFKAQTDIKNQQVEFLKIQEKFTVETLLENFIKSKSTGKIPPKLVTFEDAENAEIKSIYSRQSKEISDSLNDSTLNGNHTNDVVTGNLLNIDSSSDISSPHVSNINLATQNIKDSSNDIFDQLSNISDNNSINNPSTIPNEVITAPAPVKKQKKYPFFRKRNSPPNGVNQKPFQDADKDKSSQSLGEYLVDEEGYSIKPNESWMEHNQNSSSDSSSDDEKSDGFFKGIKVAIKPQEAKSDSSSIPDNDLQVKSKTKENENMELIKAVQGLKINHNTLARNKMSDSRSNTPSLPIGSVDATISQSSSNINSTPISVRDSRRKKTHHSQSELSANLMQPCFQVEFSNQTTKSNGLDLAGMFDSFTSRFESDLTEKVSENKSDPWGHLSMDIQSQPPPLPAKIIPPRAASTVPFSYSMMESSRLNSLTQNPLAIPSTPNRLSINTIEGIPLAISFTETVNAKFRESFSTTPNDVHTTGLLVISFPCSMLQQFESIGENQLNVVEPIHFSLTQATRLRNVEKLASSGDIVTKIENPSDDSYEIFIDLPSLHKKLTLMRKKEPSQPFFNIDIIKYDVANNVRSNNSINAPVHISANWQIADLHSSHLIITYSFQWPNTDFASLTFRSTTSKDKISEIKPHGEVRFLVLADGRPHKMQSLPPCIWNSELGRANWRLDLSTNQGTIKSKFMLSEGPGTPQPVVCQFSAEGSIESGVLLQVFGNRFRISRHKYRLISGRYIWEPSNKPGFCV